MTQKGNLYIHREAQEKYQAMHFIWILILTNKLKNNNDNN